MRNQAIVDDYFIERDKGLNHRQARIEVAKKHHITTAEVERARIWFYQEAKRRKKFNFLQKFPFRWYTLFTIALSLHQIFKNNTIMRKLLLMTVIMTSIVMASCNVTRIITNESQYLQRGDTSVVIQTKTIETYDASKKGL